MRLRTYSDGSWSAPSAIGYIGTGWGLQGGFDVTDYVIILKRQAVDSFIGMYASNLCTPLSLPQYVTALFSSLVHSSNR